MFVICRGYHVIAIEIDPRKVEMAKNNAKIYGVDNHIDFIVGDFFQLAPYLKVLYYWSLLNFIVIMVT